MCNLEGAQRLLEAVRKAHADLLRAASTWATESGLTAPFTFAEPTKVPGTRLVTILVADAKGRSANCTFKDGVPDVFERTDRITG